MAIVIPRAIRRPRWSRTRTLSLRTSQKPRARPGLNNPKPQPLNRFKPLQSNPSQRRSPNLPQRPNPKPLLRHNQLLSLQQAKLYRLRPLSPWPRP